MNESMASEPAPRQDELVDRAAKAIARNADLIAAVAKACKCCASSGYSPGGGAPYPSECAWCDHEPDRHGEKELAKLRGPVSAALSGLLADPAQTTELERARTQRNEAMETAGQLRDEVHQHQVAAANLYGRVFVALGLSITEPWAGLADAAAKVRAERDERQARIDAGLAKLKAADELIVDWQPSLEEWANAVSLIIHVRAALAGDQPTTEEEQS